MVSRLNELYDRNQWVLWRNEDGRKVPYAASGYRASTTNSQTWSSYEEIVAAADQSYSGLGFVFSEADGLCGIDIDDCIIDGKLTPLAEKLIAKAGTYAEISPSGKGVKLFGKCKKTFDGRRVLLPGGEGLELYSHGRYFTVTHDEVQGSQGAIEDITALVVDLLDQIDLRDSGPSEKAMSQIKKPGDYLEQAENYASACEGAVSGNNGDMQTFSVACKLVNEFALDFDEAMDILTRVYNPLCSPEWTRRELAHKVKKALDSRDGSFGAAYEESWEDDGFADDVDFNLLTRAGQNSFVGMPEHLLNPGGLLAIAKDWIHQTNHRDNEVLALIGAIGLMGHVVGRKVQTPDGLRTNLYVVGLAPSAGGKQAPLECIKRAMEETQEDQGLIGKVTSDAAIAKQLEQQPNSLCLFDEFGLFLQRTNKGGHLQAVQEIMLELWGASRTNFKAKSYAETEKNIQVVQPCFSMLGMTTGMHFWNGLTRSHLEDGFCARLLVVDTGPRGNSKQGQWADPPPALVWGLKQWQAVNTGGNLAEFGMGKPQPVTIPIIEEAQQQLYALVEYADSMKDEVEQIIWSRAIEKATKLAMIYACSRSVKAPVVDNSAASWAIDFVSWATREFIKTAKREIVVESRFAFNVKQVLGVIRARGRSLKTNVKALVPLPQREFQDIIKHLKAIGEIAETRDEFYLIGD